MPTEWRKSKSCPFFLASPEGGIMVADTGKMARIMDNGHGYKQVQIMRNNKRYTKYVHRLVAECFIENPNNEPEVNHKDGNKANNKVENLEWCTRSENQKHSYRIGLRPNTTEKQQAAARKSIAKAREKCREGWLKWSKTEAARKRWIKNLEKADRWHKKGA